VLVWDASTDTARLAGQMLSLAPSDTNRQPGGYVDWSGLVRAYAGVNREQLHTAALAVALGRRDTLLRPTWCRWSGVEVARHFAFLAEHNYPISAR
jgi:hypothetical protein